MQQNNPSRRNFQSGRPQAARMQPVVRRAANRSMKKPSGKKK